MAEASRGAKSKEERRCIVDGEVGPREGLIRFVIGPEETVVPDLGERLPGRGFWVSARLEAVETAIRKGLFAKAARAKVEVPEELADEVERLLAKRAATCFASGPACACFTSVPSARYPYSMISMCALPTPTLPT